MRRGNRRLGAVALATTALALGSAPGASAAIVSAAPDGTITFQGEPGETNDVSYSRDSARYSISDSGAPLTAGPGCNDSVSPVVCEGTRLVVNAEDGNDRVVALSVPTASDLINGGEGDDTLTGNVFGGPGNDTLTASETGAIADGGPGDDYLTDRYGARALAGGDGNDRLLVLFPAEGADGGDGDDLLESSGRALLQGGAGNDHILSRPEAFCEFCSSGARMEGGPGDDQLDGSPSPDSLAGGPGADTIHGLGGDDALLGGEGDDAIDVGGSKRGFDPELPPDYPSSPSTFPPSPKLVDGGTGADQITGGPNGETLHGGDGNDSIAGGEGSDLLDGGPGADTIDGGPGIYDQVDFSGQPEPVAIDLSRPGGDGRPGEDDTYLPGIEFFRLSDGNDRFTAGDAPVTVYGNLGDDRIAGSAGKDKLFGDPIQGQFTDRPGEDYGDDTLDGRGGDDKLNGDAGNDTLKGGDGDDELDGGRPVIFLNRESTRYPNDNTIHGGPGRDTIRRGRRVSAGPGNDSIDVRSFSAVNESPLIPLGRGDTVHCGSGDDGAYGDYYDEMALDCESYREGAKPWVTARAARDGTVVLKARCAWDHSEPCRGRVRLVGTGGVRLLSELFASPFAPPITIPDPAGCHKARGSRALGSRRFELRAGRVNRLTFRLSRRARGSLRRNGCLLVRAALRFKEPGGPVHEMTRTRALRPSRRTATAAGGRFGPDDRETLLLSRSADGGFPNGASRNAAISGDYQLASFAAFDSEASDIVRGDSNGARDVFVVRRARPFSIDGEPWRAAGTRLVSRGRGGDPANGPSYLPDLGGDRHHRPRCVAFVSEASNLVRGDTNRAADAFVADLGSGRVRRVSVSGRGRQANGATTEVQVNGPCTRVAFVSTATNLALRRTGRRQLRGLTSGRPRRGVPQVYVRGLRGRPLGGVTFMASASRSRRAGNGGSTQVSLSRVSAALAYTSTASNLARDRNRARDVYLTRLVRRRGVYTRVTKLVSRTRGGSAGNGPSDEPDIAAGGAYVLFRTATTNLLPHDANGVADVARATTSQPGRYLFASRSEALGQDGNGASGDPSSVEPGTNAFFESAASNLQSTTRGGLFDRNGAGDVFFWSALSRNASLQSRDSANEILNNASGRFQSDEPPHVPHGPAENPVASYYGNYLLFDSPYPLIDLPLARERFPGLSEHDAAVRSNEDPALRQVYLRYIGPR